MSKKKPVTARVKIDDQRILNACRAYSKWKDLNNIVKQESTRGINMPDCISEIMGCWIYDFLWNRGSEVGDAYDPKTNRKIEFKATSNYEGDLSTFGPETTFDNLIFLRFDIDRDMLYSYDLNVNSEEFNEFPVSSTETVGDWKKAGKRPHIRLLETIIEPNNIEPDIVFDIIAREITEDHRREEKIKPVPIVIERKQRKSKAKASTVVVHSSTIVFGSDED